MDHVLSELSTMTCPSWVALHSMAHSFTELHRPLRHNKAMIHEGESINTRVPFSLILWNGVDWRVAQSRKLSFIFKKSTKMAFLPMVNLPESHFCAWIYKVNCFCVQLRWERVKINFLCVSHLAVLWQMKLTLKSSTAEHNKSPNVNYTVAISQFLTHFR